MSNADYIDLHQNDTIELNEMFKLLKEKLIKRFLIETDVNYRVKVDAFIHGTVNNFIWATKEEV